MAKMAIGFLQSLLRNPEARSILHKSFVPNRFLSISVPYDSQESNSIAPVSEVVNELSRVLSDYRNPHHDIESAFVPFVSQISTDIVEQVLKRCSNLGFSAHRFFVWAQGIPGFRHSEESYRIVVDILGRSGQFAFLWDFLMEMKKSGSCEVKRDIFWVVFRVYSRANMPGDAIRAFNRMADFGIPPCLDDLDQLLFSLCKRKHVKDAQEFFDRVKGSDLCPNMKTYSILIRGWGDIGESDHAQELFDEMLEKGLDVDLLALNSLMNALCRGGKVDEAYKLFRGVRNRGFEPDAYSYSIFIHSYCDANDLHSAFRVLDSMGRYKLIPNVFTYNRIIKTLCRNQKMDEAYEILLEMIKNGSKPDTWSYNTILAAHCDHNEVNRALKLMSKMELDGCQPDRHTYNMVLKMMIRIGRFDKVEEIWNSMEDHGFYPSVSTYAVMVHGLCRKRSKLELACKFFEMMIDEGIPPYTSTCELLKNKLIGSGFAEQVDILADKMGRSTSKSIQEASNVMKYSVRAPRISSRNEDEYLSQSDD